MHLDQLLFWVIMDKVYRLAFLSVVQTLLGNVQWVLCFSQTLFQHSLGLKEQTYSKQYKKMTGVRMITEIEKKINTKLFSCETSGQLSFKSLIP